MDFGNLTKLDTLLPLLGMSQLGASPGGRRMMSHLKLSPTAVFQLLKKGKDVEQKDLAASLIGSNIPFGGELMQLNGNMKGRPGGPMIDFF